MHIERRELGIRIELETHDDLGLRMRSRISIRSFVDYSRLSWALRFTVSLVVLSAPPSDAAATAGVCEGAGATLRALKSAISVYLGAYGAAPPAVGWFQALNDKGIWSEEGHGKVARVPLDPWDRPYVYTRRTDQEFDIRSVGSDGKFGTSDDLTEHNGFSPSECPDPRVHFFGCSWRKPQ